MPNTPIPCVGTCNRAWRKTEATGQPHNLQAHWGQPIHCLRCHSRTHNQLAALPTLIAAIHLEALHGTRTPPDIATMRPSGIAPWPGQQARLLTDLVVGGLFELANDVRELLEVPVRDPGTEGTMVTESVSFLTRHLNWLLAEHPCAIEVHDRDSGNPASHIGRWHATAERFTARDPLIVQRQVPCPRCELLSLFKADGSDYIECRNSDCGTLLTPAEYAGHVEHITAEVRAARAA